ncbi:MAG: hypothetical protein ACP5DY_06250 [Thermovirgaceae bacterium]
MAPQNIYKWQFVPRFRRNAFGWRSDLPVRRITEALSEIKKTAKKDPVLGAEGAVIFLVKVSGALMYVDSSSGTLGAAVNNAIETLAPLIAAAPAEDDVRDKWLERLWDAVMADEMPYIELLPGYWGELCVTPERASRWADRFLEEMRQFYWPEGMESHYYRGTPACLSCLYAAGRHEEILTFLRLEKHSFWNKRIWGVKAFQALGERAEALRYAEASRGLNEPDCLISETCEEILLESGMAEEAYYRYAYEANRKNTYLATFRAIRQKYPMQKPERILQDLVSKTPGDEGKWFAAAKSEGLYVEALNLAERSPCDPRTLIRAARDMAESNPDFAIGAGRAALKWMLLGYGYEISRFDVYNACRWTLQAAKKIGRTKETVADIYEMSHVKISDREESMVATAILDGLERYKS